MSATVAGRKGTETMFTHLILSALVAAGSTPAATPTPAAASAPVVAAAAPAAPAAAAAVDPRKRYCATMTTDNGALATGSRMPRKLCLNTRQWAERGVTIPRR
jgi:hypothetical protein